MANLNIESIKKIKMSKDDHLVFKLAGDIDKETLEEFRDAVKKAYPKLKDRIVFIAGDVEITKVQVQ